MYSLNKCSRKKFKIVATFDGADDFIRAAKWLYHSLVKKNLLILELYISRHLAFSHTFDL